MAKKRRYVYGVCQNRDWKDEKPCPKCMAKEIQKLDPEDDFVCEVCKEPLQKVPEPKSGLSPKVFVLIAAVVIIGVICAIMALFGGSSEEPLPPAEPQVIKVDTITVATDILQVTTYQQDTKLWRDTVKIGETAAPEPETEPDSDVDDGPVAETEPKVTPKTGGGNAPVKTPASSIKVPFGVYSGPASGLGGEIRVTRAYSLDLRNASHETLELLPGDIIDRTKFKDGELVSGFWHRGSQSRSFHR